MDDPRAARTLLDTLGGDTFKVSPGKTIAPRSARVDTAEQRALLALTGSPMELRYGAVLGEGGMGVVRSAEQVALGRTVAVKTLKPTRRDPVSVRDLLREAWVTGQVEHPNVPPVHYFEIDRDGIPSIVFKRIEGVEWRSLLQSPSVVRSRFGATDLLAWNLAILIQLLNALSAAHSRGIVHRDLKPANVMIGDFGEVYLLDWGIAVATRDDASGRLPLAIHQTEIAGTPHYMAPEMLDPKLGPVSAATDVYLAGAVLHEIITGEPPHPGTDMLAIFESVLVSKPRLPPTIPAELARICTQALHHDAARRFASAEALRLALQEYLEHRGASTLCERANGDLERLRALLASPVPDRDQVYGLFGACRFGFQQALVAWSANDQARASLVEATVATAEYELARDNPSGALALLTDVDAPELFERARARAARHAQEQAQLEGLRRDHDPAIGARGRALVALAMALTFTVLPLVSALVPAIGYRRQSQMVGGSLGIACVFAALGYAVRNTLGQTKLNRRVLTAIVLLFVAQAVLDIGTGDLGLSVATTQVLVMMLWVSVATMFAIFVEVRFLPAAFAYLCAFLLGAHFIDYRLWFISASNLIFSVNVIWLWAPRAKA